MQSGADDGTPVKGLGKNYSPRTVSCPSRAPSAMMDPMGDASRRAGRAGRARAAWAVLAVSFALAACGGAKTTAPGGLGQARLALDSSDPTQIEKIEYILRFTYLESDPPETYSEQRYTSTVHGGQLVAILPCRTGSDGTGWNQVDVDAVVYFADENAVVDSVNVRATSVFECVRNADTRVNITLNIVSALPAGFGDLVIAPAGTLCAGKVDWKGDGFYGVCANSTCGEADAIFLFANTCDTVSGNPPTYWTCGSPTDWDIVPASSGSYANSYFPVPDHDGLWTFGLIALDPLRMVQVDPTLTDEEGYLRVWSGVAASRAYLERVNGQNVRVESTMRILDFAAELIVPPQVPDGPSPKVLLFGNNTDEGAAISFQTRFGACDESVQGMSLYENFRVVDVRLESDSKVRFLLTDSFVTFVKSVATCEAGWDPANRPTVTCTAPGPLF